MQLDVHDTKRIIERAYDSIRRNDALPDTEKQKILFSMNFWLPSRSANSAAWSTC
jgi:hypothetical protein